MPPNNAMEFLVCACANRALTRLHRKWWMRVLFPTRGLYHCATCKRTMLIPRPRRQGGRLRKALVGIAVPAALLGAVAAAVWFNTDPRSEDAIHAAHTLDARPCPRMHYYKEGETLEDIAQQELGASWRAQDIATFNRAKTDERLVGGAGLQPGMPIQIPCVN